MRNGVVFAAGAYTAWGVLPIFWRLLRPVPALEILAHRVAWALVVAVVLVTYRGEWRWLGAATRSRRTLLLFMASATLLSLNWFVYIWAVNAGYIVETSLGYFINPLVNVLLGMLFLKERLRIGQAVAVVIALGGVVYLAVLYGSLPWIALALAFSFGGYGLLRKIAALESLEGFTFETLLLFLPALGYLLYREWQGVAAFGHVGVGTSLLLALAGVATAVPLLLFAAGARRISMTTLGILQYIAPTLQFTIGVLIFGETLTPQRLSGFGLIWLALAIYTVESGVRRGSIARARAASEI
jgi:chloramphenicol-sensitive protein RarD